MRLQLVLSIRLLWSHCCQVGTFIGEHVIFRLFLHLRIHLHRFRLFFSKTSTRGVFFYSSAHTLVHVNKIHSSTVDSFNPYARGSLREWEWRNATHYTRIKNRWSGVGSQKKHSNIWHIIKSIKIGYKRKSINPISRNCLKYFAFAELSVCQKLQNSNILKVSN